jgi:hypothetical protein
VSSPISYYSSITREFISSACGFPESSANERRRENYLSSRPETCFINFCRRLPVKNALSWSVTSRTLRGITNPLQTNPGLESKSPKKEICAPHFRQASFSAGTSPAGLQPAAEIVARHRHRGPPPPAPWIRFVSTPMAVVSPARCRKCSSEQHCVYTLQTSAQRRTRHVSPSGFKGSLQIRVVGRRKICDLSRVR